MLQKAQQLKEQFSEKVAAATVPAELEQLRIEFLGKTALIPFFETPSVPHFSISFNRKSFL